MARPGRDATADALAMIEYGSAPAVLLIADSEAGEARARRGAERAGCRVAACIGMDGAAERVDRQIAAAAIFVDVEREGGVELDLLLDRLDSAARGARHASVISSPPELIDRIAARTPHSAIIQLCAPTEADWAVAAALASASQPQALHEAGKGRAAPRLQQLSEEVGRIANILASLSEEEMPPPGRGAANDGAKAPAVSAREVRAIIRARRLRDQYLNGGLFADPAWDMLLDLMAAHLEGERVAVSSLCIAAAVPPTTALRWIKTLVDQGLFVRVADPEDGRRVFIELSDEAAASLQSYLAAARRISPTLG
jgi:hypothetical protein